jgi:hypothetical protein
VRQWPRYQISLVVAALALAFWVQRDRHDDIGTEIFPVPR